MSFHLGVDLGTTYSSAAVLRSDLLHIAVLSHRSALVPSAVWLGPEGERLIGEAALRRGQREPGRLAREFKRRMGDSVPLIVGGSPVSADQLTSMLLAWIVEQVAATEGASPEQIAVTHPANWGPYRREILAEAVRRAGFVDAVLLSEPEAAAIYYASTGRVADGEVVIVYDLGGGTFDVAVLQRRSDRVAVLGPPDGVERLGGIDFDAAVFDHVRRSVPELERPSGDDAVWRAAVRRLSDECVEAKEALSNDVVAEILVMLPGRQVDVRLVRSEFEEMIRPSLVLTLEAVRRALTSARVEPSDVARVLLIGGSSRIPLVADLIGSDLQRDVSIDVHPKLAVALGAAMAAGSGGLIDERVRVGGPFAADPSTVRRTHVPTWRPSGARASAAASTSETGSVPSAERDIAPEPPVVYPAGRRRSRVPLALVAVLLLASALAVTGVVLRDDDDGETGSGSVPPAVTDATVPPVVPRRLVTLDSSPSGLASGFGAVWVASQGGQVVRTDLTTGVASGDLGLGAALDDVVAGTEALWVTESGPGPAAIHQVDPVTLDTGRTLDFPGVPDALAATDEGIWVGVALPDATGELYLIDETTGSMRLVASLPVGVHEIAVDRRAIWTSDGPGLSRLDRATNDRRDIPLTAPAQGMTVGFDAVWITLPTANRLLRLDPVSGVTVAEIATGGAPNEVSVGDGVVWLTEESDATVAAVDPATNEIVERFDVGVAPDRLVWSEPYLVVANAGDNSLTVLAPP